VVLAQVDRAERAVRALGYRDLRVRHLGTTARVELAQADLERAATDDARDAIVSGVVRAGYDVAVIAEEPLRSGSFTGKLLPLAIS
jgi:uncharacterized protein